MFNWVLDLNGSVCWVYVTNPSDWFVTPYVALRARGGIAVQQREAEKPLTKEILENKVIGAQIELTRGLPSVKVVVSVSYLRSTVVAPYTPSGSVDRQIC